MEDLQLFVRKLLEWNGCYWASHWPPPLGCCQDSLTISELLVCWSSSSVASLAAQCKQGQTHPLSQSESERARGAAIGPKTSSVVFSKPWSWRQGCSVRTYAIIIQDVLFFVFFYFWCRHWTCWDVVPMATSQPLMPPAIFTKNTLGHWDAYQSWQRQNILFPPKGFIHPITSFFFNCENDIGF